jgi:cytochrome c oxidase assembly factor CtaG
LRSMVLALALTPLDFFSKIRFHPVPLVVIVGMALWYNHRIRVLRRRGVVWPPIRAASWAFALALLAAATLSGLDAYTRTSFSVHAVEQLGLFMLAPVFACLAAPVTLAIDSARPGPARRIRHQIDHGVGVVVLNPAFTWAAYAVALFTLYFSGQYRLSMAHAWILQLTNLELFVVGYLFVWAVIGVDPRPRPLAIGWRLLYVLVLTVYYAVLGLAMESQSTPIAPGLTVSDLHTGGGVLWTTGELLTILMTLGILFQWLVVDEGYARKADNFNAEEDARQLAIWRAERHAVGLADVRARQSVIVRSRPRGTARSDASAQTTRAAGPLPRPPAPDPDRWPPAPDPDRWPPDEA